MEINIEKLTEEAFDNIVKKAAMEVIQEKIGSGINSPTKEAIFAEAERLLREDTDVKKALKDRILHWIGEQ